MKGLKGCSILTSTIVSIHSGATHPPNIPHIPVSEDAVGMSQLVASRQELLSLFKGLVRASRGFKYTDREFFLNRVRYEFRKTAREEGEAALWYKKGLRVLQNIRCVM